jgi:uncharacterized small protein (DUF1192 family)
MSLAVQRFVIRQTSPIMARPVYQEAAMLTDDERPARKAAHEVGQDLSKLSVDELTERIDMLKAEIRRLEQEIGSKTDTRQAAESLFRL